MKPKQLQSKNPKIRTCSIPGLIIIYVHVHFIPLSILTLVFLPPMGYIYVYRCEGRLHLLGIDTSIFEIS